MAAAITTLTLRGASISRGPNILVNDADLTVAPGDRIGLVGPNGIGKSTLLAALAGALALDEGTRALVPDTAAVGWLRQEPARVDDTARSVLRQRSGVTDADIEFDAASAGLAVAGDDTDNDAARPDPNERYERALERWLAIGAADFDARVGAACAEVGLPERLLDQPMSHLSGGEAARVGLAALLLSRFDVYLLDEPTNDLDLAGLETLENWVLQQRSGLIAVSHDRRFLERTVTAVAEIDHHSHRVQRFDGGWKAYVDERERQRLHAVERYKKYKTERDALAARAQRQREWAAQGQSKVRRSGENDKFIRAHKIDQTEMLAGKAAQTQRAIERLEVVESPRDPWELRLTVPDAPRSGTIVARLRDATVVRGDFQLGPIDELIEYGERVAVVGPNGAGKTTLINLILGRIRPTGGTAELGAGVLVGEVRQVRDQLAHESTLLRAFTDASGLDTVDVRTLLAKFGLVGDHVTRPAASLSPGERTRAALSLLMANGANLLVLDEPTNHLDLPAIEQLEAVLDTFVGTVLLVTHDRALLDRARLDRAIEL